MRRFIFCVFLGLLTNPPRSRSRLPLATHLPLAFRLLFKILGSYKALQPALRLFRAPLAPYTRRNSPRPIWKRLGTASNRSAPVLGRSNVHFQKRLANPRLAPDPAAPTIHQSINPSIHPPWWPSARTPCGSHPSAPQTPDARPYPQYVKELARTHYLNPRPRLTPAIKPHSQKKLIPPEGETRTFLKKVKNPQIDSQYRTKSRFAPPIPPFHFP